MRVNEIFYSLQGEGCQTGRPAVFVRFSGCNIRCPFCDTNHLPHRSMEEEEVVEEVCRYGCRYVVLTGGEPALQLTQTFVEALHKRGMTIAVETNGTLPLPKGIDWVTFSPKDAFVGEVASTVLQEASELKFVYDGVHLPAERYDKIRCEHWLIQPCDVGDVQKNRRLTAEAVEFCLRHPRWRLSLQIHKILDIR